MLVFNPFRKKGIALLRATELFMLMNKGALV